MADPAARGDAFETARQWVSGFLFLAGALAIVGSLMDWVTFGFDDRRFLEPGVEPSAPKTGFDVGDGWFVAIAGVVVIAAAFSLVIRGRGAGLSLVASMVIGGIAISDYRGVANPTSDLARELDVVGEAHVAIGLTLVVAAAILGLLASVAGIAATPRQRD